MTTLIIRGNPGGVHTVCNVTYFCELEGSPSPMNSPAACIVLYSQTTIEEIIEHIATFLLMNDTEISEVCRTKHDHSVTLSVNEPPAEIEFCRA